MASNNGFKDRVNRDVDDIAGFFGSQRGLWTLVALGGVFIIGAVCSVVF